MKKTRLILCANCGSWKQYNPDPSNGLCRYDDGFTCDLVSTEYNHPCIYGLAEEIETFDNEKETYLVSDYNDILREKLLKINGINNDIVNFIIEHRSEIEYKINTSMLEIH